jgi:hypothetical protein
VGNMKDLYCALNHQQEEVYIHVVTTMREDGDDDDGEKDMIFEV